MKIEKIRTYGWESALMGMRNPKDSWDKSDSAFGIADVEYTDVDYDIAYLWAKNELNETLIDEYVQSGSPLDKAGAYGVQDNEKYHIIKEIKGSVKNVIGFPSEEIKNDLMKVS